VRFVKGHYCMATPTTTSGQELVAFYNCCIGMDTLIDQRLSEGASVHLDWKGLE
jgi:hypothetical protein